MKNCPFSSTPGEVKLCGPDCNFYDTKSDNCGLLEIVGVLKEIKDKSEELKESFIELKNDQTLTGEKIKELPTRENMKDFSNTVREAIEPIPQKIDNYWTVSDTIIGLITKSTVLLEELKTQAKDTQSNEMLGLLKETVANLSEIKQKVDLKNIENSFKDLGNNEKDFFDTLAVDVNNSIEKNQALLIENLSSYLLSASTNIEKLLSEPNYKEIIDFLKLSEEKKLAERETALKSLEEFVAKNRKELMGSVESYFSSVKGDLSSLPSSVSEIEKFIK
ncbi:hypothetical protein JXL83_05925, partial [candidate division WOR-3 bacterium]|nr:hypothetical protein [candidate division WOR-3 bacterium]